MTSRPSEQPSESAHLWEGLEHVVDMLLLSDPRRPAAGESAPPRFSSGEEWRAFAQQVLERLQEAYARRGIASDERQTIAGAIKRLQAALED